MNNIFDMKLAAEIFGNGYKSVGFTLISAITFYEFDSIKNKWSTKKMDISFI